MKQINHGFKPFYYLTKNGQLYSEKSGKMLKRNQQNSYSLMTIEGTQKTISISRLFKLVYDEDYHIDEIENVQNEQWKPVDDTDNKYWISNQGRIKSFNKGFKARLLKPYKNQGGYERIDLIIKGRRQTKLIARLVAAAFLPLPHKLDMQLHHIDFNKNNNSANNLEWLTSAEHVKKHNQRRSISNGKREST